MYFIIYWVREEIWYNGPVHFKKPKKMGKKLSWENGSGQFSMTVLKKQL